MLYPCMLCYIHRGHQYAPECDDKCDYARIVKELELFKRKDIALPVERDGETWWWQGYCPRCGEHISYNYSHSMENGVLKNYCWKCGQLLDFDN